MNDNRDIIPLFVARNSSFGKINKELAAKYLLSENFLYQGHLVVFEAENLINCLLILVCDDEHHTISDILGIFDKTQRKDFQYFIWTLFRLFDLKEIDILGFEPIIQKENDFF